MNHLNGRNGYHKWAKCLYKTHSSVSMQTVIRVYLQFKHLIITNNIQVLSHEQFVYPLFGCKEFLRLGYFIIESGNCEVPLIWFVNILRWSSILKGPLDFEQILL